jgi:zinc transport system substrate-binding protein
MMRFLSRALIVAAVCPLVVAAPPAPGKLRIMATIFPLREFAAAVAGERGEAELLLPPGAGVHTWQPRPADIGRLAGCDLLLSIGAGLEPWLPDLLKAFPSGRIHTLEAAAGLTLAPAEKEEAHEAGEAHGILDPHVWLDFELDIQIVAKIAEELTRLDPAGEPAFAANAGKLKARLAELDARFRDGLAACDRKDLVLAGHGAFGYLARRYGLVQTALYGLSPDAQPRPRDLMKAVDFCRLKGIRTVFFENSVPPDLANTLAREIGGRVVVLHAGHNLTREEQARGIGFFELMEDNLAGLRAGLGCR